VVSYPTTWHHNIPWKTLRDSWNVIYTFSDDDTLKAVMRLYCDGNRTLLTWEQLLKKLLAIRAAIGPLPSNASGATYELWMQRHSSDGQTGNLSEEKQLRIDEEESLYSIVAWQQWNIVEGPKESVRVEDPGSDDFDDFRFVSDEHHDRFQRVYLYFEALELLIGQYKQHKTAFCNLDTVRGWMGAFKASLEKVLPVSKANLLPFQLKYWKAVKFGGAGLVNVDGQNYQLMAKRQM
jgi:hypothetical protein